MNPSPRAGFLFALSAYLLWGILPLFFRAAEHIPALELVAHRAIWSLPSALIVMALMGRLREIPPLLRDLSLMKIMALTAFLISINWLIYVWAVSVEKTAETALGYYINPLITVALGVLLLGEGLNRAQKFAIALAAAAVLMRTIAEGILPWIPLSLALTFAAYGYIRKTVSVGPTQGFMLEVILIAPFGLAYAIWLAWNGQGHFSGGDIGWLVACGPVTAAPLILYAFGAKGLRLATLGLMQYIAPSIIFIIAIGVFGEPLGFWQGLTFVMVWTALVVYSVSTFRKSGS